MPIPFKAHDTSYSGSPLYFQAQRSMQTQRDEDGAAITVMQDFSYEAPLIVRGTMHVAAAEEIMQSTPTRDFLVCSGEGAILGVVSHQHLHSDKLVQLAHDLKMSFKELEISDVMTPLAELARITLRDLFDLTIGGLLRNFSDRAAPYILVVSNTDPKKLVGMFSRERLRADWQLNVTGSGRASSFAELERRLLDKQPH